MQSSATILAKTSYGSSFKYNDSGPFESLIQFLMQEKAKKVYPHKHELIEFQLNLLELTSLLKAHNGDATKSKEFLEQIQQLHAESRVAIEKINQLDAEFKKYSNDLISKAKLEMPKALESLIYVIAKKSGNKISDDIKMLFYNNNNLPLSGEELANLKKERGI